MNILKCRTVLKVREVFNDFYDILLHDFLIVSFLAWFDKKKKKKKYNTSKMSEVMTKVVAINRAISEEQYRSNHPFYNRFKELIGQLPCAHSGILQPGYSLHGGTNNKNDLCEKTRKKRHLRKLTVKNEIYHWMPNQNRDNAIAGVCATCPVLAPVIATLFAELPTTQT